MAILQLQTLTATPEWTWGGDVAYLRIFASQSFYGADGTFVSQGQQPNSWYQEYTCNVSGTVLTIPQVSIQTTTDSSNPNVTYNAFLYDSTGSLRNPPLLANFRVDPTFFQNPLTSATSVANSGTPSVNGIYTYRGQANGKPYYNLTSFSDDPTTASVQWDSGEWHIVDDNGDDQYTSSEDTAFPWEVVTWAGTTPLPYVTQDATTISTTWEQLTLSQNGVPLNPWNNDTLTTAQIYQLVNRQQSPLQYASSLGAGKTYLSVDPVLSTEPIAVGANDPHFQIVARYYLLDYANLAAAITAIGSTDCQLVVTGALSPVTSDLTTPVTMQIVFEGNGSFTVSSGHTLIISSIAPLGAKRYFFGTGHTTFAKGAVTPFNLAWWAGTTPPADADSAMIQALASLSANAGGILLIPAGVWTVTGGYTLNYPCIIQGVSSYADSGRGSTIQLKSGVNNTSIFKATEDFRNWIIKDLILDCGTSTGSKGFSATDATLSSGFGGRFENVIFHNGDYGDYWHSTDGWETEQILFDHCQWVGQTVACHYDDSQNGAFTFLQPYMACGDGVDAFLLVHSGATVVLNHTIVGPFGGPVGGICFNCTDAHTALTIMGGQDEGMGGFLTIDSSDYEFPVNLKGNVIQSLSSLNGSCIISSSGNTWLSKSIICALNTGCYFFSDGSDYVRNVDVAGDTVIPQLVDPSGLGTISLSPDPSTLGTLTYNLPTGFAAPGFLTGDPTTPVASFGNFPEIPEDKVSVRLGRTTADGTFDYYYDFIRQYATGRLLIVGNQTGFRGVDVVDADLTATSLTANDATTPIISTTAGGTNTGYLSLLGKTSGGFKILPADATAHTVTQSIAAQTVGTCVLTIPNQAGTSRNFVFDTLAQTLTNKTLTTPTISNPTVSTGTFTSPTLVTPSLGIGTAVSIAATGALTSSSPSAGIGYATGAGNTVTQITSRVTEVVIDALCGQITLFSDVGTDTPTTFEVRNTSVGASDLIILNQISGTDQYQLNVTEINAVSFFITFVDLTGTTTEAPVFGFAVLKGVTA